MEGQTYKDKMTCEEEWYFKVIRNGYYDPKTIQAHKNLALWFEKQGNLEKKRAVYEEVLYVMVRVNGYDHEATELLRRQNRSFSEAEEI